MRRTYFIIVFVFCSIILFASCDGKVGDFDTAADDGIIEMPFDRVAMINITSNVGVSQNVLFSFVGEPGAECIVSAEGGSMLAFQGWDETITQGGFYVTTPIYEEVSLGKISAGDDFCWTPEDDCDGVTYMRAVFYIDGEIAGFAVIEITTDKIFDEDILDDVSSAGAPQYTTITMAQMLYQCVFSDISGSEGDAAEYIEGRTADLIGREWRGDGIIENISDIEYLDDGVSWAILDARETER